MRDIVIASPVGVRGTLQLLHRERERLLRRFSPGWLAKAEALQERWAEPVLPELSDPYVCREAGKAGIYAALWELAEQEGCGLKVQLRKIPILQETIEICNELEADPYRMDSGSCYLFFCEGGMHFADRLREAGFPYATVAGYTTGERKRLLLYGDNERYLTRQ